MCYLLPHVSNYPGPLSIGINHILIYVFRRPGLQSFGGRVNFGANRHQLVELFANQKSISNALGRICRSSVRNCADSHAPYRCCHPRAETQRGLSRLVGRDLRRGNEFDTHARGQHGRVVHFPVDARFQQDFGEPPDIVQHHRVNEVEQPHAVVLRGSLREDIVLRDLYMFSICQRRL